jgi:hypothetical protein
MNNKREDCFAAHKLEIVGYTGWNFVSFFVKQKALSSVYFGYLDKVFFGGCQYFFE